MSKVWLARVTNGKPLWSEWNMADIREWCKGNEGKLLRLTYETPKRSNAQNRYYWLYLGVIAAETGDDENSLHEYFRRTLLPPKLITAQGKNLQIPRSTTDLNKIEMGEYLDRICALTNVPLPDREAAGYYVESKVKKLKAN